MLHSVRFYSLQVISGFNASLARNYCNSFLGEYQECYNLKRRLQRKYPDCKFKIKFEYTYE